MTRRGMKVVVGALALPLVAVVAWVFLAKVMVTRELTATLETTSGGPGWAIEWERAEAKKGLPAANGAWIDLSQASGTEQLVIECSGVARKEGATFRLWLYRVVPARKGEKEIDLKAIVAAKDPARVEGRWLANPNGAGVVFEGPKAGKLVIDVPLGGASLLIAKTDSGGAMRVRLGETEKEVDAYAPSDERVTVEMGATSRGSGRTLGIVQRLPTYGIKAWRLKWPGEAGGGEARAMLRNPEVTTRVGERVVMREAVRAVDDGAAAPIAAGGYEIDVAHAGALELVPPSGLPLSAHAGGVVRILVVEIAVVLVLGAGWWVARRWRPRAWWADVLAFAVVIAAHVWMSWWAPLVYCPDSVDYMSGAIDWAEGRGSLARFDRFRLPGYPFFAGVVWKMAPGAAFNAALGSVQCALGIGTAALAWLVARRFLPRGWATVVLLAVGTNPILLAWERFAMSETLSVFLATLAVWMTVEITRGAWGEKKETWVREQRGRGLAPLGSDGKESLRARAVVLAVAIGLTAAAGAWVRGNLQLLIPACPALIAVVMWTRVGWWRAGVLAGVAFVAGVLPLVPRVVQHQRDHGMAGFTLGSSFSHYLLGEPNGVIELNQSGVLEFEEWRTLRDDRLGGKTNEWGMIGRIMGSKRLAAEQGVKGFGAEEAKYRVIAEESFARLGDRRGQLACDAFLNVLGLWPWDQEGLRDLANEPMGVGMYPWRARIGFRENEVWTRPLRGVDVTRGTNFFTDEAHAAKHGEGGAALNRYCRRTIATEVRVAEAKVFDDWFRGDRLVRPIFAGLCVLGMVFALARREWGMAWVAGLVMAHAAALAWIMLAGLDRYGVVMEPMLRIGAVYAVFVIAGWWREGHGARREGQEKQSEAK